jgi:hypothetical protein
MRGRARSRFIGRVAAGGLALLLAACATPAPPHPSPSPAELARGWKVYTYGSGQALVGVTTIPNAPADTTRPEKAVDFVTEAFCTPVADEKNPAAEQHLRDFCRHSTRATTRVVLAPDWNAEVPQNPDCFIHCVCEGHAPRTDDPSEKARESDAGPCTNRLNCRLDCPAS